MGLLVIDISSLRSLNEELGLAKGDEMLRWQANVLQGTVDKADTLARLQGDIFAIIRHSQAEDFQMAKFADQILKLLAQPITLSDNNVLYLQPSIGIAIYPRDGTDNTSLLQAAEHAHSMAKRNGRHRFQFVNLCQHELHHRKLLIEQSLQEVLTASLDEGLSILSTPSMLTTGRDPRD